MLGKNWPIDRFVEVIDGLPGDLKIVLTGAGEYDFFGAQQIENSVCEKKKVINLVNKTSVSEMVALIANALFVLGNDSAAVHIASSVHVPSVVVLSGAEYGRFLPYPESMHLEFAPKVVAFKMECYNCKYNCKHPNKEPFECVRNVSVDMVKNAILPFIS